MTWSKNHTFATVAILGVVGYMVYKKYSKNTSATGGMTNFTGRAGMNDAFVNRSYNKQSGFGSFTGQDGGQGNLYFRNASGNEPMRDC